MARFFRFAVFGATLGLGMFTSQAEAAGRAILFEWEAIEGAERYQIQVFAQQGLRERVINETVRFPMYRLRKVEPRDYYWRVRGIDSSGGKGRWSPVKVHHPAAVEPEPKPKPAEKKPIRSLRPKGGAAFALESRAPKVGFAFNPGGHAGPYTIEIASDQQFRNIHARVPTRKRRAAHRMSTPGVFFWRVTSKSGEKGEARSFSVVLGAPTLSSPSEGAVVAEDEATLTWLGPRVATRWQVEVQTPAKTTHTHETNAARHLLSLENAGTHQWRVRGWAGRSWGNWSAPRTFDAAPKPTVEEIQPQPAAPLVASHETPEAQTPPEAPVPTAQEAPSAELTATAPDAAPEPRGGTGGWTVGAHAGLVSDGALFDPLVRIDVAWSLFGRVSLTARAGFYRADSAVVAAPQLTYEQRAQSIPITVAPVFHLKAGEYASWAAGIGPAVLAQNLTTGPEQRWSARLGVEAFTSLAIPAGPGELVAELAGTMTALDNALLEVRSASFAFSAGYRVTLEL